MRSLAVFFSFCLLVSCAQRRQVSELPKTSPKPAEISPFADLSPKEKAQTETLIEEAQKLRTEEKQDKTTLVREATKPVTIGYVDIEGFDVPRLVIKLAALNKMRTPDFHADYEMCPTLAREKMRSDSFLYSCVKGVAREEVFMLPVYSASFTMKLSLCDGDNCYYSEDIQETNPRPLTLESEDHLLNLAKTFTDYHDITQSLLTEARKIFEKILVLDRFVEECHHNLSQEDVNSIGKLKALTLSQLEEMILEMPTEELLRYLPQETAKELAKKGVARKTAESLFSTLIGTDAFAEKGKPLTLAELFNSLNFFIFAAWGIHGTYQDVKTLYSWSRALQAKRTVEIAGQKVVLKVHSKTGFLVHPDEAGLPIDKVKKFYLEDPVTKDVVKAKGGDLITVNPLTEEVKYIGGRYYEYNYEAGKYKVRGAKGEIFEAPNNAQDLKALFRQGGYSFPEKVLQRVYIPKMQQFGILEMQGGKPVFLDQRKFLEKYGSGVDFGTYRKNITIPRPEYAELDSPKGILQQPMTAVKLGWSTIRFGIAVASMYALVNRIVAVSSAGLQLSSSEFCQTPVSLVPEMQKVAEDKWQLFFLKAEIAALLRLPAPVFDL